ncbi:hypothetical protein HDV00_002773, partial [Rhizophlyctis rosea]
MDPHAQITSVTFSYPVTTYDGIESGTASLQAQVTDLVRQQCDEVAAQHGCQVAFSTPEPVFTRQQGKYEFNYSLSVTGTAGQVQAARGALLRNNPTQIMVTVKVHRPLMLNENGEMRLSIKRKLDDVMKSTRTQITCVGHSQTYDKPPRLPHPHHHHIPPPGFMSGGGGNVTGDSSTDVDSMDVEIVGGADAAERARMKCLVLFDELSGLYHEVVELDPKLQTIIAGRKRCILDAVMHDTMTNIYLPSPFAGMQSNRGMPGGGGDAADPDKYPYQIHITGEQMGVTQARDRLLQMAFTRKPLVATRAILCLPRKLDWMLINCKDQIKKIMTDNACFVSIPLLGSNSNILHVTGDDGVYLERAIRAVNLMCCDFYAAVIEITPPQSRAPSPIAFPPLPTLNAHLGRICQSARAEVVFSRSTLFEIYGLEAAVKSTFMRVAELEFVRAAPVRSTKIQLETALEHREFINGKKSGKVNKIVKTSGSDVKFETRYNDYNMLIDLWNMYPSKALEGLALLEDELPAEISFYVPEAFHKRIIGVGGKNIQRIMKKHGVYVKFSNAEEHALMGGYFENQDNVIARTPSKNSPNLEALKGEVVELVMFGGGKGEVNVVVNVPRQLHRVVVGARGGNIRELEAMTKVKVTFPEKESGGDEIGLGGPEPQVQAARHKLQDLIPDVHSLHLPATTMAHFALRSPEFAELVFRLHQDFSVQIYLYSPPPDEPQPAECAIWMYVPRGSSAWEGARKVLVEYLGSKQVPMEYLGGGSGGGVGGMPRSGSYANLTPQRSYDSFQHFNSKLLASVTAAPLAGEGGNGSGGGGGGGVAVGEPASYSLFHDMGVGFDLGRTTKPSQSVPNLRQLFEDGPRPSTSSVHINGGGEQLKRSLSEMSDRGDGRSPDAGRGSMLGNTLAATTVGSGPFALRVMSNQGGGGAGWGDAMFQRASSADTVFGRFGGGGVHGHHGHHHHQHSLSGSSGHHVPDDEDMMSPDSEVLLTGLGSALSPHDDELPSPTSVPLKGEQVRVPTAKFRGMSLSRSMPGGLDEGEFGGTLGPADRRSGLSEEVLGGGGGGEDEEEGDVVGFSEEVVEELFRLEGERPKAYQQIRLLLHSLDLDKFIPVFVDQEVDFPTLLSLSEGDLKELGVTTFGSRKKIVNAVRQCNRSGARREWAERVRGGGSARASGVGGDGAAPASPGVEGDTGVSAGAAGGRSSSGSSSAGPPVSSSPMGRDSLGRESTSSTSRMGSQSPGPQSRAVGRPSGAGGGRNSPAPVGSGYSTSPSQSQQGIAGVFVPGSPGSFRSGGGGPGQPQPQQMHHVQFGSLPGKGLGFGVSAGHHHHFHPHHHLHQQHPAFAERTPSPAQSSSSDGVGGGSGGGGGAYNPGSQESTPSYGAGNEYVNGTYGGDAPVVPHPSPQRDPAVAPKAVGGFGGSAGERERSPPVGGVELRPAQAPNWVMA